MNYYRFIFGIVAVLLADFLFAGEATFFITENGKALSNMELIVDGKRKPYKKMVLWHLT